MPPAPNKKRPRTSSSEARPAPGKRRCPKCTRVLPVDDFSRASRKADGRQCYCKECNRRYHSGASAAYNRRKAREVAPIKPLMREWGDAQVTAPPQAQPKPSAPPRPMVAPPSPPPVEPPKSHPVRCTRCGKEIDIPLPAEPLTAYWTTQYLEARILEHEAKCRGLSHL